MAINESHPTLSAYFVGQGVKIMINSYQSVIKASVYIIAAYCLAFFASFFGYGLILVVTIFLSIAIGLHTSIKDQRLLGRVLVAILFILLFCLLNFLYTKFSDSKPKSEFGFVVFWSMIQCGMFLTLVILASMTERFKNKSKKIK